MPELLTTASCGDGGLGADLHDSPMTSILWAAATVKSRTSPRLVDRARANGMEINTEKSKIMTNTTNNVSADMSLNGLKLD